MNAVYGIAASSVPRRTARIDLLRRWRAGQAFNITTIVASFIAGAVAAGAIIGACLGLIGGSISVRACEAIAILVGLSAFAVSMFELRSNKTALLQRDRETPRLWLDGNPYAWAVKNGMALGAGFTSRLGYALWYLVPVTAFLVRNYAEAAVIFASYSFTRTASSAALLPAFRRYGTAGLLTAIDRRRSGLKRVTAAALGAGGLALSISAIPWRGR